MIIRYIILFTTLILLLGGNTFTNLFPMALCEEIDSLQSSQHNEEKNDIYLGMILFGISILSYLLYIKCGGGSGSMPSSPDSFFPPATPEVPSPILETTNSIVLQREVVASVDIPPRPTFTNQYTLELGQKIYQQTKEIAALNTQIASLHDTIFGLENKVYISQAQVESYRSTINELQQRINFFVEQNKLFGHKTQLIVDYLMSLYDIHPDILSRTDLNNYLRANNLA